MNVFGLKLEEGVVAALVEGFKTVYASEVAQHNGGLAVRVVEEAVGRFATWTASCSSAAARRAPRPRARTAT